MEVAEAEAENTADIAENLKMLKDEEERCRAGLVLAAAAAAACRSVGGVGGHSGPGYADVTAQLLVRVERLLARLGPAPVCDLRALDAVNDSAFTRLDRYLKQLEEPFANAKTTANANTNSSANANDFTLPPPIISSTIVPEAYVPPQSRRTIPRPQLTFSTQPDNSDNPWRPIIDRKPNAITPLRIEEDISEDGRVLDYVHPYLIELDAYSPPELFLDRDKLPPIGITNVLRTPFKFVSTEDELDSLVEHLKTVDEIAVDLEHHSYRTFQGITCLIQLTTEEGGDFIIDALVLRSRLQILNVVFTDPKILKVFHGADSDIKWLQRDFGVYVVGMFDTHRAAIELGHRSKSLQSALATYCEVTTDKSLSLSDWRVRPLPTNLLNYARVDTHFLLFIWRMMREELLGDSDDRARLLKVFSESRYVCMLRYNKPQFNPKGHLVLCERSRKHYNARQTEALRLLYKWRNETARTEDESIGYVLPNHMLLEIAYNLPKESSGILACCLPTPPLLIQHLDVVYRLILRAATIPLENIPAPVTESIQQVAFSPMIYDRQVLENDVEIPPFEKRIVKLTKSKSKESLVTSRNVDYNSVDLESITKSFVPPYERFLMIKHYYKNRKYEIKETPVVAPLIEDPNKNLSIVEVELENGKITFNKTVSNSHKNKRSNEIIDVDEEPKAKKRPEGVMPVKNDSIGKKVPSDGPSFESFDYKKFDYNVFSKEKNQNKKKKKSFSKKK